MVVEPTKRDLVVKRTLDAPPEAVWKAWVEPEMVKQWWGPDGFTCPLARMDVREGGASLVCMSSPEFGDLYNTWTYVRIVPNQEIEYILGWADKDGNTIDPASIGMPPDMPRDVRHVVSLRAVDDNKTEMTVTEYDWESDQLFDMSKAGLEQCLDKMAAILADA